MRSEGNQTLTSVRLNWASCEFCWKRWRVINLHDFLVEEFAYDGNTPRLRFLLISIWTLLPKAGHDDQDRRARRGVKS